MKYILAWVMFNLIMVAVFVTLTVPLQTYVGITMAAVNLGLAIIVRYV